MMAWKGLMRIVAMLVVTWSCAACTHGGSDATHKEGHLHCSDSNCEERNRVCIPATETSSATCGDCVEDAYEHASACYPLTLCRSTEYESFPPSRNRDRECTPYSVECQPGEFQDRKSTRLNSSHVAISYAVFCLKKKTVRIMR